MLQYRSQQRAIEIAPKVEKPCPLLLVQQTELPRRDVQMPGDGLAYLERNCKRRGLKAQFLVHWCVWHWAHANAIAVAPDDFQAAATHEQRFTFDADAPSLGDGASAVGIDNDDGQQFGSDVAVNLVFVDQIVQCRTRSPFTGTTSL